MTNTNRGLNRLFIFIVGLIVFILGIATASTHVIPAIRTGWEGTAPTVQQNIHEVHASAMLAPGVSWITIGVLAVLAILTILLVAFIVKQGHGRTSRLIRDDRTDHGVTVIDSTVAEEALQGVLNGRPELVFAHVSTFDVKGAPTLKVSVTALRGVSPKEITTTVESAVRALDALLGREIPTYLHISGGFRARTNSATRLQ